MAIQAPSAPSSAATRAETTAKGFKVGQQGEETVARLEVLLLHDLCLENFSWRSGLIRAIKVVRRPLGVLISIEALEHGLLSYKFLIT